LSTKNFLLKKIFYLKALKNNKNQEKLSSDQ